MKTNTEINAWEMKMNPYYEKGINTARPDCWEEEDRVMSVSNIELTDKMRDDLANPYITKDLVKVVIGDSGIMVNGTDLIVAVENALHASRMDSYVPLPPNRKHRL